MDEIVIEHSPAEARLNELGVFAWPVWEKEASDFPWQYDAKETCYLLEGEVTVTPDGGDSVSFGAGDLVWFGVIFTINIEVSLLTPPVGMNLFVLKGIAPHADMSDIIMGALPYVGILTLGMIALTVWPQLATWLPNLVMP